MDEVWKREVSVTRSLDGVPRRGSSITRLIIIVPGRMCRTEFCLVPARQAGRRKISINVLLQ